VLHAGEGGGTQYGRERVAGCGVRVVWMFGCIVDDEGALFIIGGVGHKDSVWNGWGSRCG